MFLLSVLIAIQSANLFGQQDKGFSITGHIAGLKEGEQVFMKQLVCDKSGWDRKLVDSGFVKNGRFYFAGSVSKGPRRCEIYLPLPGYPVVDLYIDNGDDVTISCSNPDRLNHSYVNHHVTIEGSRSNYALAALRSGDEIYYRTQQQLNAKLRQIQDSIGFNAALVGEIIARKNAMNNILYGYLLRNPEPDYVPGIPAFSEGAMWVLSGHAPFWIDVYNSLDEHLKMSFYGNRLKERLPLCIGTNFPEFVLPTSDGKSLAIKDVIAKNKVTLIQFWSFDSYERINLQSELMALYKKYQAKGLKIVGVSSDTIETKWKLAAAGLPWQNVSDLKGGDGIVEKVYHEYVNNPTTNVLIDSNGRIIAWDVSGIELQWYLWKYLGE